MEDAAVDLWATDEYTSSNTAPVVDVGATGNQGPRAAASSDAAQCGYFGAVRLRDGKFQFSRETGKFNAMTFFAFLKGLRRTSIRTRRRVVVITDNARYHHARLHKEWRATHDEDFARWITCRPTAPN
jgi:DDE superfamily endonuclease